MKTILTVLFLGSFMFFSNAQEMNPEDTEVWDPEPRKIIAGVDNLAPSDAHILLGEDHEVGFKSLKGPKNPWFVDGKGVMTVVPGSGDIITDEKFSSCQLHLEFATPNTGKEGQLGGNSGIFFQNRYEVQILNSFENRTYSNGQAASVYKQTPPLVNASRAPEEWQTYDIIFLAPEWNTNGSRKSPGFLTVFHNGVLVQNHTEIQGSTEYIGPPKNISHGKDVIKLQDHGDKMKFRNIWLREL